LRRVSRVGSHFFLALHPRAGHLAAAWL